jgi:chromosome segregation ATPase
MNNRGKTSTIFIILIVVLLASSTSIGFFLYNKEMQLRKSLESQLENSKYVEMKLQGDVKEARRQMELAEDKTKETDEKINNLMDEMDLNEGVRKELKAENASLKESIELAKKDKEKFSQELEEAKKKYAQVTELFKSEQDKVNSLQVSLAKLQTANEEAEKKLAAMRAGFVDENGMPGKVAPAKIELDKIVVNPK